MVYDSLNIRLSKSSVLQAHAVLRKSLKDAVKEGLIVSNPMDRVVSTPKLVRKEMEYLNQEEISLILSKDGEWAPMWSLLIGTGLRIG
jgi:integrase